MNANELIQEGILVQAQLNYRKVKYKTEFLLFLMLSGSSFPIQLENPHVIERHQMMVGVVTKAPDGATLNSSYETRCVYDKVASKCLYLG